MLPLKEIAKFASGAEAFHALIHAVFGLSGTTLTVFGMKETPKWHKKAALGNAFVAVLLALYAWGPRNRRPG